MSERPKLPYIEFTKWAGLNTKTSPDVVPESQLIISQNTDYFSSYGSISKPDGMSRVLSSILKQSGVAVPVSWLGFYKAADLDGQILRHNIMAGGIHLYRIETDGSTTQLTGSASNPITTNRTSGLFHSSDMYEDFLLVQNQDPDLVGSGDDPVKYDGAEVHLWGVRGPGTTETVREEFDSSSTFTDVAGTSSDDTTTTQDGAAKKFVKATSAATASMARLNATSFDATASGEEKVYVWVYIPRGELRKLVTSGRALSVYLGSDTDLNDNYHRYDFKQGSLLEGWNLLIMDTNPDPADPAPSGGSLGGTSGTLVRTAIISWKFEVITNNATDVVNLRWDRMYTTDEGRLTATDGAAGSNQLTAGEYKYKVTFMSNTGHESNAGPTSDTVTIATTGNQCDLTNIPTSSDPQVIARKLYRTVADGELFLILTTINDNTTTTYTDTTPDLSLGSTDPPVSGSVNSDSSIPPKAGIVKVWKRTVFLAGDPSNPFTVYFSEDDLPEAFPTVNSVTLDDKITGMYESLSGLVIETETGKWQVTGDNPDFKFDKVVDGIGCVGNRACGEARLTGYASDRDGLYLYDLSDPIKISETIRDKYDAINRANIEDMHISHLKSRNSMFVFTKDSSGNYTNNFVYQYLQDVSVTSDLTNGWWSTLVLPASNETFDSNPVDILCAEQIEDSDGDIHLYVGGNDGMVYKLFDSATKNWTDANGTAIAITTIFESKFIRPGDRVQPVASDAHTDGGISGRAEPRWIEVRRSSGTVDSSWSVQIDTADWSATSASLTPRDTTTITVAFSGEESFKRIAVPSTLHPAEFFRVKLTNNQQNVNDTISAVRLYYHMRPGQYEV